MESAKAGVSDWPPFAFIGTNFSVLEDLLYNLWFEAVVFPSHIGNRVFFP